MTLSTVTWRQVAAALAATVIGLLALVVVVRADGLAAVDASSARSTGWFVHRPTGRVVLVDGYRGVALGSIDSGVQGEQISVADGFTGAYVLNDTTAEARSIDTASMRLGTAFGLASLGGGQTLSAVGQAGLVVVDPDDDEATVVPVDGEPVSFEVDTGSAAAIGRDGALWSIVDGSLVRSTSRTSSSVDLGVDTALLTTVGSEPLVVDVQQRRARFGTGAWHDLPTDAAPSEIVVQAAGPGATCGWVAADDELWCVGKEGIEERSTIDGLDVDGADLLAIAGDAGAVVRRGPSSVVRIDWRAGKILDDRTVSVRQDAALSMSATVDLVWIDDTAGDFVWAVNPWSIETIDKNPSDILVLGDDGDRVDGPDPADGSRPGTDDRTPEEPELREPDDNGIDDPPVAIDDPVTARSGSSVTVEVTANDYDPDGEAIAVSAVGVPGHGTVEIGSASTIVYTPDPGYVGLDQFAYTIVDGNGTPATADVIVELIAADAVNQPPVGVADTVETGAGVAVVVDVLLNDIDPERDGLRISSFSPPELLGSTPSGEVTEVVGPSGQPALQFVPGEGFEGTATFSYRPVDSLGAIGDDVEVRVEVASSDAPNRPPVTRPDAIRARRDVISILKVLDNDIDPDGDSLTLDVVRPVPAGLDVEVQGAELAITARAGAPDLVPFQYEIEDPSGHSARGWVLVSVIDDVEPNRPPVVTPDTAKVVAGESVVIDVTANDIDQDGDPLTVIAVDQRDDHGQAVVFSRRQIQFTAAAIDDDAQTTARLTYTVTDGQGHAVTGDVTITILPEALVEPPFARDDSTFTYMNVPVTVDVLRNDGDPSGGRPTLAGKPGCPSGGSATITTDGQVRFDPPANATGAFRCTYEVTNATGARASASIIVSVRERALTNLPPQAVIDRTTVEIGKSVSVNVTDNDNDPDGDSTKLRVVSSTAPVLGTAQRTGNVITFTAGSETGSATINYQVVDEGGAVALGQLDVRITELANAAPIARPDAKTVFAPSGPVQFSVLDNDADPDETAGGLTVTGATLTSGPGSVSYSGSLVTLTPPSDFLGQMTANYTIADGLGLRSMSTVTLTVERPPNRAPDARDDTAEVGNGGSVSVPVLFNDTDLDGDRLTVSIASGPDPALGVAGVGANGAINFTARPGASGTAVIAYQVSDGALTDTALLTIVVYPCAQSAPVANDGFLRTGYQASILVDLAAFGANGDFVDLSGPPGYNPGTGIYTPPAGENGNVVVNYSVVNGCRMRASGRITIDVNQEPVAQQAVNVQVLRGGTRNVPVTSLASDAEPLVITDVSGESGMATFSADTLTLSPTFATDVGSHIVVVTVSDPGGLTARVTVVVAVSHPAPIATADTVDASAGDVVTADLVLNDSDLGGLALSIKSLSTNTLTFDGGGTGTVTVLADGRTVSVDPGSGVGRATFAYTVRNPLGGEATATVSVLGPAFPPPTTTTPPTPTTPTDP